MRTDIEIAQQVPLKPITEIASMVGILPDELELYGKYKAKITDDVLKRLADKPSGKLILVTAINPTPAGEGKTTTTVGLGMAMHKIGKNSIIALREPSLGPVFGIKGGAAGGGLVRAIHKCRTPRASMLHNICSYTLLPIVLPTLRYMIALASGSDMMPRTISVPMKEDFVEPLPPNKS